MQVHLFPSGELVDELFLENGDLAVQRVGRARYVARFREGPGSIDIAFWTTQKGRIQAKGWPDRPPWLRLDVAEELVLESVEVARVDVHLEHMDRGHYFLGFSRGEERWALSLVSEGYVKTRVLGGTVAPQPRGSGGP